MAMSKTSRFAHALLGAVTFWGGTMAATNAAQAFDCTKAYLGVDFVICSDPKLIAAIDDMGRVWQRLKAATSADQFNALLADQRQWLKTYGPECGLPAKGQPSEQQIAKAAPCVRTQIDERLKHLTGLETPPAQPVSAGYAWKTGFAQGTVEASIRNDADSVFTEACPAGQLETAPSISYSTFRPLEAGKAGPVAFTLIIDDTKERLYLARKDSDGAKPSYGWTAANDRQIAEMSELVERIRTACHLAIDPTGSATRDEFSTRDASSALTGILKGCEAMEHEMAAVQPQAATAPQRLPQPASSPGPAAAPPAFGGGHLSAIIEAAQTNAARFARDYKGKSFRAQATFLSLQDGFFGQKQLTGQAGANSIQCCGRSDLARAAIDWRIGEMITISGIIDDTVLGSLMLNACTASK